MKRIFSVLLSVIMLLSSLSFSATAFAASAPKKVEGVKVVTTIDRMKRKVTFKVSWKAQKGVAGYQVCTGGYDWGDGHRVIHGKKKVKGAKKTSASFADEYNGGMEYDCARVRAYKKTKKGKIIYGKWSKFVNKSVRVVNQVTGIKGSTVETHHSARRVSLKWNPVKGAAGYTIRYTQYSDASTPQYINVKGTSYTGWLGNVYLVTVRWYKIVNGKKIYSDWSDRYKEFSEI